MSVDNIRNKKHNHHTGTVVATTLAGSVAGASVAYKLLPIKDTFEKTVLNDSVKAASGDLANFIKSIKKFADLKTFTSSNAFTSLKTCCKNAKELFLKFKGRLGIAAAIGAGAGIFSGLAINSLRSDD